MTRLTFTPGNHQYWLADPGTGRKERLVSVTGLLGQLDKPALKRWAANTAADFAIDHWADLGGMPLSQRRSAIAGAPWQDMGAKAARGTEIHAMAEQLLAGQPVDVPAAMAGWVEGLARWLERAGFAATLTETQVWSGADDEYALCGYAGTFDAYGQLRGHGATLVDWKTGSGVYPDFGVQLAGYALADYWVVDGEDGPRPHIDTLAVAHIRPDGTSLHILDQAARDAAARRFELLRHLRTLPEPTFTRKADQ